MREFEVGWLENRVNEALEYQRLSAAIKVPRLAARISKMLDEEDFHDRWDAFKGYIKVEKELGND